MAEGLRKNSVSSSNKKGKQKKGWECPYCGDKYPNEADSLLCDTCESWVCLPCTRISKDMYQMMNKMHDHGAKGLKWVCRMCDRSMPVLKEMNNTLGSIMKSNNERFDAIETQVNKLESSIGDKVSEEVSSLKDQLKDDLSTEINNRITERLQEENDRQFREMNMCFFNLPVSGSKNPLIRKKHDEELIQKLYLTIVEGEEVEKPTIKNVFRLPRGKHSKSKIPVTKATFVHKHDIRQFLTYARKIKDHPDLSDQEKKIITTKDLSVEEREQNKQLRLELKEKNKDGNNFTIRNGNIVPRVSPATDEEDGSAASATETEEETEVTSGAASSETPSS